MKYGVIYLVFSLFVFVCTGVIYPSAHKVVVIGIDGCRADALKAAHSPTVDSLLANATYSWDALTIAPTVSGPCWSSMLTGVWHYKHGVTDNSFSNDNYAQFPPLFQRIKEHDSALITASAVNWKPINDHIVTHADYVASASSDEQVATIAADYIRNKNTDFLFVQFDEVDGAGHANGYGVSIPGYMQQVEKTDTYIKIITDAINSRPAFNDENWVIILASDHGGFGSGHGGNTLDERNIVFIVSGKNIPEQEIKKYHTALPAPGTAVQFDGFSNYARVDNQSPFLFGSNKDFSIECFVKTSGWTGDPAIISNKDWNSGYNKGFVLACTGGGVWKVNIGDGSARVDITGGRIDDGLWHHLVATCDRDGDMTIYQDGARVGSKSINFLGDINSGLEFAIGQDGTLNYPNYYNGLLAEIRVWDNVLPDSTIKLWFAKSVDDSFPEFPHLISYWKLNDGDGKILQDLSANKIEAELTGDDFNWLSLNDSIVVSDYENTPRIVDVPVTALAHLGVSINPEWDLDGQPVGVKTTTKVENEKKSIPAHFTLYQNYPNPFNPTTRIEFQLPSSDFVGLVVYNTLGETVQTMIDGFLPAGKHRIELNAAGWSAGLYFYRLKAGLYSETRKILLVK